MGRKSIHQGTMTTAAAGVELLFYPRLPKNQAHHLNSTGEEESWRF